MRPVNLLPEEHRARQASGAYAGSAYVVVGVLAVLVAMATVYVLTGNQVSSRQADAARAQREAERTTQEISALGSFGSFTQLKETRVASVRDLAQARFDWERFVRELALVLPRGVWLTEVDATTKGKEEPGAGGAPAGAATPEAKLKGCAPRPPVVASLLVRLRKMHGVKDVELKETARQAPSGAAAAALAPAAPGAPPTAPAAECLGYVFDVTVQFAGAHPPIPGDRVPASLGGGG